MSEPIENALRRLREDAAGRKGPDGLEAKLLASYRARHASRKRRSMGALAGVAASIVFAMLWSVSPSRVTRTPDAVETSAKRAEPTTSPVQVIEGNVAVKTKPRVRRAPIRQVAKAPSRPAQEFFEIPYAPALADYDSGRVVRVNMPGASVRNLGFPVMSDRVQADVFVGDDGVARAIRVVSSSGLNFNR